MPFTSGALSLKPSHARRPAFVAVQRRNAKTPPAIARTTAGHHALNQSFAPSSSFVAGGSPSGPIWSKTSLNFGRM